MQALIDYIKSDFDIGVYWKTLNDNGINKERLLSYDRAIHSEPNFRRDQKEGLLRDLGHYMRTLKVDNTIPFLGFLLFILFVSMKWLMPCLGVLITGCCCPFFFSLFCPFCIYM